MRTAKQRARELERLAALKDEEIDTSDLPEVVDWSNAETGKFYRPVKQQVTLRIDADVLAWFKAQGSGYQTVINRVLRGYATGRAASPKASVRTGEACPASGVWHVEGDHSTAVTVSRGDSMPSVGRRKVKWVRRRIA